MSILIKGIDLPKGARYADVSFLDKYGVPVGHGYIEEAIQIPTPHGRLIDGDMVADMLDSMMAHHTLNRAYDEVMDAPTILEAEE